MWRAWHLHYPYDRDRLLEAIVPRWSQWLAEGRVERLFFIRYREGGPHLRIRGEWKEAAAASRFERDLRQWVSAFCTEISSDGSAPEASLVESPYSPEVARYGGSRWMPVNHELFSLSSWVALRRARGDADERPGRLENLALVLKLLLAGSIDAADRAVMSRYPPDAARELHRAMLESADRLLDRQPEAFEIALAAAQVSGEQADRIEELFAQGLGRLARQLDRRERRRVVTSHIHMTMNRLGIDNREELLLLHWASRLVERIAADDSPRSARHGEDSPEAVVLAELRRASQEALDIVRASIP